MLSTSRDRMFVKDTKRVLSISNLLTELRGMKKYADADKKGLVLAEN